MLLHRAACFSRVFLRCLALLASLPCCHFLLPTRSLFLPGSAVTSSPPRFLALLLRLAVLLLPLGLCFPGSCRCLHASSRFRLTRLAFPRGSLPTRCGLPSASNLACLSFHVSCFLLPPPLPSPSSSCSVCCLLACLVLAPAWCHPSAALLTWSPLLALPAFSLLSWTWTWNCCGNQAKKTTAKQ